MLIGLFLVIGVIMMSRDVGDGIAASAGLVSKSPSSSAGLFDTEPVSRLLNSRNLENVMKALFTKTVVISARVRKGAKTSANIYVNKAYVGKRVTVIIWE